MTTTGPKTESQKIARRAHLNGQLNSEAERNQATQRLLKSANARISELEAKLMIAEFKNKHLKMTGLDIGDEVTIDKKYLQEYYQDHFGIYDMHSVSGVLHRENFLAAVHDYMIGQGLFTKMEVIDFNFKTEDPNVKVKVTMVDGKTTEERFSLNKVTKVIPKPK